MEINLNKIASSELSRSLFEALKPGQGRPVWASQFAAAGKPMIGKAV